MKNVKLLLAAAALFCGVSSVYANSDATQNGAAMAVLSALPASQISIAMPTPVMRPVAQLPVEPALDRSHGNGGGGNNNCTQNPAVAPGKDFSPHIDDAVRTQAINSLLGKIATCQPLPYAHDGIINTNSEGHMPQEAAGYYKEYTLIVPGRNTGDGPMPVVIGGQKYMTGNMLSARGPERIIIGQGSEIYYTMDHYATFVKLTIVK